MSMVGEDPKHEQAPQPESAAPLPSNAQIGGKGSSEKSGEGPTPRTDEFSRRYGPNMCIEIARQLERELDELQAVFFTSDPAVRDAYIAAQSASAPWQAMAYAKLGVVRDKMPPEHVTIVQDFIGPLSSTSAKEGKA